MLKLAPDQKAQLAAALDCAQQTPALAAEIDRIYADFEAERATQSPRCDQSGKCCRFEAYGHRLFVTTIELAVFHERAKPTAPVVDWDGTGCPYQRGGLCSVHMARPFGCRVYFCDPTADAWQQAQYERFHAAIRELHVRYDVPYWYVEWREGLSVVGVSPSAGPNAGPKPSRSLPVL
jgi:Fe-S-cluster containining protein